MLSKTKDEPRLEKGMWPFIVDVSLGPKVRKTKETLLDFCQSYKKKKYLDFMEFCLIL